MYRKIEEQLNSWKNDKEKKALLISGARQIGKTWAVRDLGKSYKNFVELNFVTEPQAADIFKGNLDADTIIMNLTAYLGKTLEPGKTLVFFDEIQECPEARTAIKFLVEDGRFDYVESGSLLGVRYKPVGSYPVGFETEIQMYPMDFQEFCIANGVSDQIFSYLEQCYKQWTAVSTSIHETMSSLFRYYTIVGGMPEVVQEFISSHDIGKVVRIQNDIVSLYRQDISKYALDGKTKITEIFDNIPSQLDDKNRRFMLSSLKKSARMRDYEDSFLWLRDAGVALPCPNITAPTVPLQINEQSRLFKLFMNDSGLLCAMGMENVQFSILNGDFSVNMGSILENVFATQLTSNGFKLRYMNKRNVGELDFVVQRNGKIIPLEIKSGKDYKQHKALNNALSSEEWKLNQGIVFCMGNVETDEKVLYLPWYMIMFFKQYAPEHMVVDVDLSGLKM